MWDQALCSQPGQGGRRGQARDVADVKAARSRPDISAANTLAEKRKGGGERDRTVLVENAQNTEAERPEFTPLDAL